MKNLYKKDLMGKMYIKNSKKSAFEIERLVYYFSLLKTVRSTENNLLKEGIQYKAKSIKPVFLAIREKITSHFENKWLSKLESNFSQDIVEALIDIQGKRLTPSELIVKQREIFLAIHLEGELSFLKAPEIILRHINEIVNHKEELKFSGNSIIGLYSITGSNDIILSPSKQHLLKSFRDYFNIVKKPYRLSPRRISLSFLNQFAFSFNMNGDGNKICEEILKIMDKHPIKLTESRKSTSNCLPSQKSGKVFKHLYT